MRANVVGFVVFGLAAGLVLLARRADAAELPGNRAVNDASGRAVPRGIRNNNPGNLRPGDPWQGLATPSVDEAGYLIFTDAVYGIRALALNLLHQTTKHGLRTVREIIEKWAPKSENPHQAQYVANVAAAVGADADAPLDLAHDRAQLEAFVRAVIRQENGVQPYGAQTITAAINQAEHDA